MKKSRIAKLALLGASTAALAATLTTSTYAWYVSNKTATVQSTTGATAAAAADGSILLSLSGNYGAFYKSIDLGDFVPGTNHYGLVPVLTTTGISGFQDIDGNPITPATLNGTDVTTDAKVYHYQFYILAVSSNVTVTPTYTITNTTGTKTSQVCNANGETWNTTYSIDQGQTFTSNALNALCFSGTSTPSTVQYGASGYATAGSSGFAPGTSTTIGNQQLSTSGAIAGATAGRVITANTIAWTSSDVLTAGAHDYYNLFADTALTEAQKKRVTNSQFSTFNLDAATPVRLDYYIYLDGASDACYNACAGQDIQVEFSFTATPR